MEIHEIDEICFSEKWNQTFYESIKSDSKYKLIEYYEKDVRCGFVLVLNLFSESEIVRIAVIPEYRRRGIAEKLIKEVINYSKEAGYENIFLEVRSQNFQAKSLYIKLGFEECGIRKQYYKNPKDDAIIMVKRLI